MGVRRIPRGMNFWPDDLVAKDGREVQKLYEAGFAGAYREEGQEEAFRHEAKQRNGFGNAAEAASKFGYMESGKGKLILPFIEITKRFPGCLPGPAQKRGDCVSHDGKNATLLTMCCDIASGLPDARTGKIEGVPEISAEGIAQGVLSTEYRYWLRGHGGDGWDCYACARVALKHGILLRKDYPELGIDLTRYSGALAGKWGRTPPPENILAAGDDFTIHTATPCDSAEDVREMLANGQGISSCGSEGFSSKRNEHGVSNRQGSWSHAMALIGFDDRPWAHQTYGGPLACLQNSWAIFNSGNRIIFGTDIEIPHGSFWARWKDIARRSFYAHAGFTGWQAKQLQDYGATGLI